MTSTSFNVGLSGDGSRLSSRVLRPPGGGHTDIFGGDPEPPRGRRLAPPQPATNVIGQGDEPKATNGTSEPAPAPASAPAPVHEPEPVPVQTPEPVAEAKPNKPEPASFAEPARAEPPKRVRVPPGGFSSGLCGRPMEGGGKSRLSRLLHRLRGDHHKYSIDKAHSFCSAHTEASTPGPSSMSGTTGCGSTNDEEDFLDPPIIHVPPPNVSTALSDDCFPPNIDLRYGGQYMTVEQLPGFCDQLHHLVEVIRNIQSYAHVTGEYPTELERRLEREAREVSALAAETRNARDVIQRTRVQRRALHDHRRQLQDQLASLKDTEVRELENTVRMSDRKLYKSWEASKESSDPTAFDTLIEEVRNKQTALESLLRLIDGRRATMFKNASALQPLPPPMPKDNEESSTVPSGVRKRHERRAAKRRRNMEPRSVPLSSEPSAHAHLPQVTLYIQGSEPAAGRRPSVALTPLELPSGGSVRDILFFTANTT